MQIPASRHFTPISLAAHFNVDRQTLAVLAPTVTQALGISEQNYGWLASAFSIAYLVGAPLAGRMIDAVGARRGLLGAVVVWSIVAALHALAPGFAVLFALRIALGLAEAPSFPGAAQTVHRALPRRARSLRCRALRTARRGRPARGHWFSQTPAHPWPEAPPLVATCRCRFGPTRDVRHGGRTG